MQQIELVFFLRFMYNNPLYYCRMKKRFQSPLYGKTTSLIAPNLLLTLANLTL